MTEHEYSQLRHRMVEEQIFRRGVHDARVLWAMRTVPRHLFVPAFCREEAYDDTPLPIGYRQTISQPYMVAMMLEALGLDGPERVLEVGTGSGYQAALLGWLAARVYTVEVIPELAERSRRTLEALGYPNVVATLADGSMGWESGAPYDAIVVAAASPNVPAQLVGQLNGPGRLVVPVGTLSMQTLLRVRKAQGRAVTEDLGACSFVPLVGEEGWGTAALSGSV